jgi:phosphopantothenoylcysteine synthetase/decarboxylase
VRFITNASTGRLGALIRDAFLDEGAEVEYIHAGSGDAENLRNKIASSIKGRDINIIIHAAAVSDYRVKDANAKTKISSDKEELTITLERVPKIISSLRIDAPQATIVGFKLLANASKDELLRQAKKLMDKNGLDFVVANDAGRLSEDKHFAYIIDKGGSIIECMGKKNIAEKIAMLCMEKEGADG